MFVLVQATFHRQVSGLFGWQTSLQVMDAQCCDLQRFFRHHAWHQGSRILVALMARCFSCPAKPHPMKQSPLYMGNHSIKQDPIPISIPKVVDKLWPQTRGTKKWNVLLSSNSTFKDLQLICRVDTKKRICMVYRFTHIHEFLGLRQCQSRWAAQWWTQYWWRSVSDGNCLMKWSTVWNLKCPIGAIWALHASSAISQENSILSEDLKRILSARSKVRQCHGSGLTIVSFKNEGLSHKVIERWYLLFGQRTAAKNSVLFMAN